MLISSVTKTGNDRKLANAHFKCAAKESGGVFHIVLRLNNLSRPLTVTSNWLPSSYAAGTT